MTNTGGTPAGWYHAPGDAEGTQRYWDGGQWIGDPQPVPQQSAPQPAASDPTVGQVPPAAYDPSAGQPPAYGATAADQQPPAYGAPAGGQQPPAYGAPAGGQQPPAYGSPPPGAGVPPGYTAYGDANAAQTGNLAEPVQRIVGRLVDAIIWIAMAFAVGLIFGVGAAVSDSDVGYFPGVLAGLIGLALVLAYEILLTTKTGNTLGKKIFGIKIVNVDGSAVDEKTMFMRMLPYIALSLVSAFLPFIGGLISFFGSLAIGIISIVFLFTDSLRQAIWDKISKTKVVAGD